MQCIIYRTVITKTPIKDIEIKYYEWSITNGSLSDVMFEQGWKVFLLDVKIPSSYKESPFLIINDIPHEYVQLELGDIDIHTMKYNKYDNSPVVFQQVADGSFGGHSRELSLCYDGFRHERRK